VIVAGRDGRVRCLDAADGRDLWQFQARGACDSSPVVAGSRVVFGSSDGNVYLLNLADGSLVWSFTGGGTFSASAAVGQGRLVIGNEDGTIYCFGAKAQAARGNSDRL
jgi:outer membrane protein assembly factor BamB